jgi:two-component system, OmpR family, response regulator
MSVQFSKMPFPQPRLKASTGLSNSSTAYLRNTKGRLSKSPPADPFFGDGGTANSGRQAALKTIDDHDAGPTTRQVRLLLAIHDSSIRDRIIEYLKSYQLYAISVADHPDALCQLLLSEPDLILLDTRLDHPEGRALLRDLRSTSGIPVIMINREHPNDIDRITALELGADDCVTEPFGLRELLARIRAVLRRYEGPGLAPSGDPKRGRCRFAGWQLDRRTRRLTAPDGNHVALTRREYALLTAFLGAPLQLLSRERLLQATRVHENNGKRSIDVEVYRLRRKLTTDPAATVLIRTERGRGYVWTEPVQHL